MRELSDDAKAVAGAHFGLLGKVGSSELIFHMIESKPTRRMQAALDELVELGFLTRKSFNRYGGVVYTLARDCKPFARWFHNQDKERFRFPITEPINRPTPDTGTGEGR